MQLILDIQLRAMVMVFNDTFNNTSVTSILWRSVLLVEETELPGENYRPVTDKLYYIMLYRIQLTITAGFELTSLVVLDTDCTGTKTCICKFNNHTTTTAP
jgi:hypothetical protein